MTRNSIVTGLFGVALGVGLSFSLIAPANAVPVTWDLTGVTFNDGGAASGSFVFDASTDTYSSWNITTSPGSLVTNSFDYTNVNSALQSAFSGPTSLFVETSGNVDRLLLVFVSALTDSGGVVSLRTSGGGFEIQLGGDQSRTISGGSVDSVVSATPLPAALPLFATGLGALGLLGWRRKRKAKAA
jgi:hypothetical protein